MKVRPNDRANMIKLTINLPAKRRLDLGLTKRRKSLDDNSLQQKLGSILRVKKGSKFSRLFRHVFEHKNVKKLLASNLAILLIATSIAPVRANITEPEQIITKEDLDIQLTTEVVTRYPVDKIKISQEFKLFHPGIDLDGLTGDAIYPIKNGEVVSVRSTSDGFQTKDLLYAAYGNAVLIEHAGGLTSLYAHLSKINVVKGQNVNTKTIIGEMGATGRSFGDHLHLEIRKNGIPINPHSILRE